MKILKAFLLMLIFAVPPVLHAETPKPAPAPVPREQVRHRDDSGPSSTATEVKTYEGLRHAISKVRIESRVRVEKAVEQERVREAWEIGRLIDAHVLQHKERADYGKQVLERLANDLGMNKTELYYELEFYRAYPIFQHAGKLSWSEQQALLAVNDPKERKALEERAVKENWSRDKLREEVKALKTTGSSSESGAPASNEKINPIPHLGNPGVYRIFLAKTGPYAGELTIDLGFSNYVRLADEVGDMTPFADGDIVAFLKEDGEVHPSREEELYAYRAWVLRVLDGDTVEAVVDLGFGFTTRQTLRLRGIDAPEIQTRDGMEAKEFVEAALAKQGGKKQSIYIKTSKSDKYDRYLVDVFITDKSGEAKYLNNLLLEHGVAVKVKD